MKQYTVAVLGATGAVGQEMMKILSERPNEWYQVINWCEFAQPGILL